ncbi:response regulator transcription factor [Paenibacillus endoradicis]|uniref:response regulator transcription factor n=1 Tax=Paenibacillus endoradicis TaxID=2972487 RepID=UPI0021597717|nr:response regulator transcription factor [Paenibacillus endoradicis]
MMNPTCQILIVDDEVLVRQGIKHLLNWESEGFSIVGEASNGKEALELVGKLSPHIVITDIVMPLMDGVEFTSILKSNYPQIEVVVLSSFGEFNYVRSTFQSGVADYILKPKLEANQLLTILKRAAKKIPSLQLVENDKDEFLSVKMTLDKLMSGYEMDASMESIHNVFPHNSFRFFGAEMKYIENANKEFWLEQLSTMFHSYEEKIVAMVVPTDNNMAVYLLNMNDRDWEQIMAEIRSFAIHSTANVTGLCWTLGDPFTKISELYEKYHQGYLKMCSYRFYLPQNTTLIIRNELPKLHSDSVEFNMSQFTELMQSRNFNRALEVLFDYIKYASTDYEKDVFAFKTVLGNIVFNITIILGKLEMDTELIENKKYNYFRSINEAKHVSDALKELHAFIDEMNVTLAMSKQTSVNPNMSMILSYIRQHYMDPINLTDIANHFHFNPSYLSSFFSSHNDEGFSEYLNRVRVNKAAELLQKGELSISDISEKVGYSDHSYFTKVFKKINGVSPSQYRKGNQT